MALFPMELDTAFQNWVREATGSDILISPLYYAVIANFLAKPTLVGEWSEEELRKNIRHQDEIKSINEVMISQRSL